MYLFATIFIIVASPQLVDDYPRPRQNTKCNETACFIMKFDSSVTPYHFVSECRADKIKIITFIDNVNCAELPAELFSQVKYLTVLTLNESRVERIVANTFKEAKYLEEVYLTNNLITVVEDKAFDGGLTIKSIDLSGNLIESIQANAFVQLKHLQQLNLANNHLSSLDKNVFVGLDRVTSINLSGNELVSLDTNIFYPCKNLAYLYIQGNQLVKLRIRTNYNTIYWLNADDNAIEDLYLETDEDRNRETFVYITANRNQIDKFKISEKYNVRNLYFENNKFINLFEIMAMSSLVDLRLGNNNLSHISANTFKNLRHLEILYLQNTNLPAIRSDFFENQRKLKTLHIGYNQLNVIDLRYLKHLSKLEQIHLDGNELTDLNVVDIRDSLPSLRKIELRDNLWNCMKLKTIIGYLKMYNVNLVSVETMEQPNVDSIRCFDEGREVDTLKQKIKMLEDKLQQMIETYNMNFCALKENDCCSQAHNLNLFVHDNKTQESSFSNNYTCTF